MSKNEFIKYGVKGIFVCEASINAGRRIEEANQEIN